MRFAILASLAVALLASPCMAASSGQDGMKICAAPWKATSDADKVHAKSDGPAGKPENIVIAVDRDENIYYNNVRVRDVIELRNRFVAALRHAIAAHRPLPVVHIRGDKNSRFEIASEFARGNASCPTGNPMRQWQRRSNR